MYSIIIMSNINETALFRLGEGYILLFTLIYAPVKLEPSLDRGLG